VPVLRMAPESSVLLFGVMDPVGLAIAAEIKATGRRLLVGTNEASDGARSDEVADDTALRGDLTTVAGGLDLAAHALRLAGSIDTLILHPGVGDGAPEGEGSREWALRASSVLKVPFFLARDFALRMGTPGGRIVFIVDARRREGGDSTPAHVLSTGLSTMTQALAMAVPASVRVSSVVLNGSQEADGSDQSNGPQDVARAVRFLLEGEPRTTGTVVQLGLA
jgi:hypothetical protein